MTTPSHAPPLTAIDALAVEARSLARAVDPTTRDLLIRCALAAERLAEAERQLTEADAVIADGHEEAQYRDHILSPEEYEQYEKAALARYASRHPKEPKHE